MYLKIGLSLVAGLMAIYLVINIVSWVLGILPILAVCTVAGACVIAAKRHENKSLERKRNKELR